MLTISHLSLTLMHIIYTVLLTRQNNLATNMYLPVDVAAGVVSSNLHIMLNIKKCGYDKPNAYHWYEPKQ